MSQLPFKAPYPRPTRLSDPHNDNSPEKLAKIIATNDSNLSEMDLYIIFCGELPAGTYREIVYFLPIALRRMTEKPENSLQFIDGVVLSCANNIDALRSDKILPSVEKAFRNCLDFWTNDFTIIHNDAAACKKDGSSLDHFDYVNHIEAVLILSEALLTCGKFDLIVINFLKDLATSSNSTNQAWFLTVLREKLLGKSPRLLKDPKVTSILLNPECIAAAISGVKKDLVLHEKSPTYWSETIDNISTWMASKQIN